MNSLTEKFDLSAISHYFVGIFSEACIKLAHMHSDAVDFPKTGECPLLPKELRPTEYPDFMMKGGKPRYK